MKSLEVGKIKFYNPDKGWGFIKRDGQDDTWFHINDFNGSRDNTNFTTPDTGMDVTFEITTGREGKEKAINIDYAD